jgi:L-asparaginase II
MLTTGGVVRKAGAALELPVVNIDTAVNDVGIRARAGAAVVDVVGALLALVGNASQTPRSALLGGQSIEVVDLVFLDKGNLGASQLSFTTASG